MEAEKLKAVKINGHRGKWYSIDSKIFFIDGEVKTFYLMEHETFGDEADWIIIDEINTVILENLNGFLYEAWAELDEYFEELIASNQ